ncbi:MAG: DUF4240 domain-containing protein [Bacteroidota bacterium]
MRLTIELSNTNELKKVMQLLQSLQIKEVNIATTINSATPTSVAAPKSEAHNSMGEATFWEIIHHLAWEKAGDNTAVLKPAAALLMQYSKADIFAFHDLLSEKLYHLDGQQFVENASTEEAISADLFLYARCFVVASGKAVYYQTLNNPSLFPKNLFFDELLYLPESAWQLKTNQSYTHLPKHMYETGFNQEGWGEKAIVL